MLKLLFKYILELTNYAHKDYFIPFLKIINYLILYIEQLR